MLYFHKYIKNVHIHVYNMSIYKHMYILNQYALNSLCIYFPFKSIVTINFHRFFGHLLQVPR